jgi:ABC-2 type transport system permease protein
MVSAIAAKAKIAGAIAFVTYKEWAVYRTHSMISIFVGPMYYLVQLFIWRAVYTSEGVIAGMSLGDMLRYYAAVALIGYLTMDFADWNLQMLIRTGKYLNFSLKPMNHRFFALSQKLGHRTLGLIYEVIPVALIFVLVFRIDIMPENLLLTAISVLFSFFINFFVNYSIGLLGFWFTQTGGIKGLYTLLVSAFSGVLLPITFYPQLIQKVILFLPFSYITYVPAMVWTGKYTIGGENIPLPVIVSIQGLYVLASFVLCAVLGRVGNKRFSGVGA